MTLRPAQQDQTTTRSGDPVVHLVRCADCGTALLGGETTRCPRCLGTVLRPFPLSGDVTLHSFTELHRSFPLFATPFILGWVDHPSGVRLLARIAGASLEQLSIGMTLEVADDTAPNEEAHGHVGFVCGPPAMKRPSP